MGAFFSLFGIYLSYYLNIASEASLVLLSTLGFAVSGGVESAIAKKADCGAESEDVEVVL